MIDILNRKKLKGWLLFRVYRLHLHCDVVFIKRLKKWKKFLLSNSKILEIGPGGGPWTIELLLKGNEVTCVDISLDSLDRLKRKVEFFPLSNKNLKLVHSDITYFETDERYDQILLFETLEHIRKDRFVIKKLVNLLNPDGQFLISTPSDDYIPYYGEKLSNKENGGHVRKGYSFEDYKNLFRGLDVEIIYKDSCAGFFTQKLNAFQRILTDKFKIKGIFKYSLIFLLRWIAKFDFLYPNYPKQINFIIVKKIILNGE